VGNRGGRETGPRAASFRAAAVRGGSRVVAFGHAAGPGGAAGASSACRGGFDRWMDWPALPAQRGNAKATVASPGPDGPPTRPPPVAVITTYWRPPTA
jgi:hypothetical protein